MNKKISAYSRLLTSSRHRTEPPGQARIDRPEERQHANHQHHARGIDDARALAEGIGQAILKSGVPDTDVRAVLDAALADKAPPN